MRSAYERCQSIEKGYYEMTKHMKYMSGEDTVTNSFHCYFQKDTTDSIYTKRFHYEVSNDEGYIRNVLYTGSEFVRFSTADSAGMVMSVEQWADDIQSFKHNYTFYDPITRQDSRPMCHDSVFQDSLHSFYFMGEENLDGKPCYHIKNVVTPVPDSSDMIEVISEIYNYWIRKGDYLPIQYSINYDLVLNNDTMHQYELFVLDSLQYYLNEGENHLSLNSIPSYINLKEYQPFKSPEPFAKGARAPEGQLTTQAGDTLSISSLEGKLILLDFFYKSCYPCRLAIPGLQKLHEKYHDQGLLVVGVNPFDSWDSGLDEFLENNGVDYIVGLTDKELPKKYKVSSYPTVYLLNEAGEILFHQVGYGVEAEKELEAFIQKRLSGTE